MNVKIALLTILLLLFSNSLFAQSQDGWFVRPYIGLSQMSDIEGDTAGIGSVDGVADISLDTGFTAGLGVGYRYNANIAAEIAWEYRSNESGVALANAEIFEDGNYASNIFFVNGFYYPHGFETWQPYLGAGLSWIQEIDIDLETGGAEQSYSGSGDFGFQLFAGVDYPIAENWDLQGELRYGSVSKIDLEGEGISGGFNNLDYDTFTIQLGAAYRF